MFPKFIDARLLPHGAADSTRGMQRTQHALHVSRNKASVIEKEQCRPNRCANLNAVRCLGGPGRRTKSTLKHSPEAQKFLNLISRTADNTVLREILDEN